MSSYYQVTWSKIVQAESPHEAARDAYRGFGPSEELTIRDGSGRQRRFRADVELPSFHADDPPADEKWRGRR